MPLNPPLTPWPGRIVWLLGASSGIGRATAAQLHELGARVIVSARQRDALDAFAAQHPGSLALPLDVTDAAAVGAAADRVVQAYGSLDLVFYCAGIYTPMRAAAFDLEETLRHLRVNYVGALHLLQAVLPTLLSRATQGGRPHLSLVSSVAGYRGLPKALAYGPTKAALINLAEILYLDLRDRGVGVSVVNPGFVETPATSVNDFEMPALITADEAARQIVRGWERGEFEIHFPKRFTRTLKLLRWLPDRLYFAAIRKATGL